LLTRYRVDDVPWPLRPLFHLYGYGGGVVLYALVRVLRALVRVQWDDVERARGSGRILCAWHENVVLYFVVRPPLARQAWINHPYWYMRPVHVLLAWVGVERVIPGSTGAGGRAAVDELARLLASGGSTTMFPDGPTGPAHELKKGVLHLAARTGLPIVPVRFALSRELRLPGWDRKRLPLPGAVVRVSCGEPLLVADDELESAQRALVQAL